MVIAIATLLALAGFFIGWNLPDIDQVLWFTTHRSILTHSFVLPVSIYLAARNKTWLSPVGAGACFALTVHLFLDLFPQAWHGYALIHVPLIGRLNPFGSVVFILSGVLGAGTCAGLLLFEQKRLKLN